MVLGQPNTKCPHGVYKAGQATAQYCSFCNPASASAFSSTRTKHLTVQLNPEVDNDLDVDEILDAAEFIQLTPGQRMSA